MNVPLMPCAHTFRLNSQNLLKEKEIRLLVVFTNKRTKGNWLGQIKTK